MPTSAEVQKFQSAFATKYSMLKKVSFVMDGLKLYLEQSGDNIIQTMFYNGWTHDRYIRNVFIFEPNGVLIACAINSPGSMHEFIIAEWEGCKK